MPGREPSDQNSNSQEVDAVPTPPTISKETPQASLVAAESPVRKATQTTAAVEDGLAATPEGTTFSLSSARNEENSSNGTSRIQKEASNLGIASKSKKKKLAAENNFTAPFSRTIATDTMKINPRPRRGYASLASYMEKHSTVTKQDLFMADLKAPIVAQFHVDIDDSGNIKSVEVKLANLSYPSLEKKIEAMFISGGPWVSDQLSFTVELNIPIAK